MDKDKITITPEDVQVTWDEEPEIKSSEAESEGDRLIRKMKEAVVKAKEDAESSIQKALEAQQDQAKQDKAKESNEKPKPAKGQGNGQGGDVSKLREKWLKEATERLYPGVLVGHSGVGAISCGYGKGGNRSTKGFSVHQGGDGNAQIFIHPDVTEKNKVLAKIIAAMQAISQGFIFHDIQAVANAMPPYPQVALAEDDPGQKKDGIRQLKCFCMKCGYTVRTSRKWLDIAGAPLCPTCIELVSGEAGALPWPSRMVVDGATKEEITGEEIKEDKENS